MKRNAPKSNKETSRDSGEATRDAYDKAQERLVEFLENLGVSRTRIQVFNDICVSGTTSMEDRPHMTRLTDQIAEDRICLIVGSEAARFFRDVETENAFAFVRLCSAHNVSLITDCYERRGLQWFDLDNELHRRRFTSACASAGLESGAIAERLGSRRPQ